VNRTAWEGCKNPSLLFFYDLRSRQKVIRIFHGLIGLTESTGAAAKPPLTVVCIKCNPYSVGFMGKQDNGKTLKR
jgi:hypothetical protein